MKAVGEKEVEDVLANVKYALMLRNISQAEIRQSILKEFEDGDEISICELTKVFSRLTKQPKEQCEKLARYLIERPNEFREYNKYLEADVCAVYSKLCKLLGDYSFAEGIETTIAEVSL